MIHNKYVSVYTLLFSQSDVNVYDNNISSARYGIYNSNAVMDFSVKDNYVEVGDDPDPQVFFGVEDIVGICAHNLFTLPTGNVSNNVVRLLETIDFNPSQIPV